MGKTLTKVSNGEMMSCATRKEAEQARHFSQELLPSAGEYGDLQGVVISLWYIALSLHRLPSFRRRFARRPPKKAHATILYQAQRRPLT